MPNQPNIPFVPCKLCEQRFAGQDLTECPILQHLKAQQDAKVYLIQETPFSEWHTPEALSKRYNYSAKHILRLVKKTARPIASLNIQGRWFILRCAFENYLRNNHKNEL